MKRIPFQGRVVILGCGGVARCTLPLLLKHLDVPPERVTVVEKRDFRDGIRSALERGVRFLTLEITRERMDEQLGALVGPGDLLVDLAWNIGCIDLLKFCRREGVLYINTSVELWDPYADAESLHPTERTLYARHMEIRKLIASWGGELGPTAVLDHGANPGLVSHFTKRGLRDIAAATLELQPHGPLADRIHEALERSEYNHLAHRLGVRVLHVSETDTQETARGRADDEFVNTWSVQGFHEEAIAPAELGWGTHERTLPADGHVHSYGPRNQICLTRFGMDTLVRSRVPSGEIIGMVVRHGEAFSISEYLTVNDGQGTAIYRPTVHYAYQPCPEAQKSIIDMRARQYHLHPRTRVMGDEITSGADELGVLFMGHAFKSWWTGTVLGIEEARQLVPGQNATTLQVAASVMGAIAWMLRNPRRGVCLPDQLPFEEILDVASPYLGQVISQPLDWMPRRKDARRNGANYHLDDAAWQFSQFLIRPTGLEEPARKGERRRSGRRTAQRSSARRALPVTPSLAKEKARAHFRIEEQPTSQENPPVPML